MGKKTDIKVLVWLEDISMVIDRIEGMFGDQPKIYAEFQKNWTVKMAVERGIEIIGEATNRILKEHPEIEITNARKIVDARNRIIHGYETISDEAIWNIVINHLPLLKTEVEELLKK
jgi:uncharacterized protein with HEPN domain